MTMLRLFKITLLTLISLTTLNAGYPTFNFPDDFPYYNYYSGYPSNRSEIKKLNNISLINDNYLKHNNDIYSFEKISITVFAFSKLKDTGYYGVVSSKLLTALSYYDNNIPKKKIPCRMSYGSVSSCSSKYKVSDDDVEEIEWTYNYSFLNLRKVATCQPDENFNTETKQCQKCDKGYSWNPNSNRCYRDCTNLNKNKWGGDDGTPQGVCWDCSGSKTLVEVMFCACKKTGSQPFHPDDVKQGIITGVDDVGDGFYKLTCEDGSIFHIKDPTTPDVKDPNKPQDPKSPDTPNKDNNQKPDKNNTEPKNPNKDNNQTKSKDNNSSSQSNSNNNNQSGSKGNKDNKDKENSDSGSSGKDSNSTGGITNINNGSGNSKDKDAKFNEGDFGDGGADKERDGLFSDVKNHINNNLSKFDGITSGINQFISNVQGKGFTQVKADIKNKCPITREITLPNGNSKRITVDYCDIVSPASETTYYVFYIGFAVGGFLLFLKLLLLSF